MTDSRQEEFDWEQTARAVERRQRYLGMPKTASRWVNQIVARFGVAQTQSAGELESVWSEVVGEALAGRTKAGPVRRGVCEITVENSSLLQQIVFRQKEYLQQMQIKKPHFGITSLRFRVGPIR